MDDGWSPKLISSMLAFYFGDDQTIQVSHETIYQALYVQTRGALRADLAEKLNLKRKQRVPQPRTGTRTAPTRRHSRSVNALPRSRTGPSRAIGRATSSSAATGPRSAPWWNARPGSRSCSTSRGPHRRHRRCRDDPGDGQAPGSPARSITWDRGTELAEYAHIQTALNTTLYFCDPHSPWQRGTNENTNRLLRFWFEKGSDLAVYTPEDLRRVAAKLNAHPGQPSTSRPPANRLNQLLQAAA